MIAVTRSKVKPGQMFKILPPNDIRGAEYICVALDREQLVALLQPGAGRIVTYRDAFYHAYVGTGEISWMWDREVWVDDPGADSEAINNSDDRARTTMLKDTCTTLGIRTLETRNSDRLDFHELAVWSIKAVVEAAYDAGLAQGRNSKMS